MKCRVAQFRLAHAIFSDFARACPSTDQAQWKAALLVLFPIFLAEATGEPLPAPAAPESTRAMSAARMSELIAFLYWIGTEIGVVFSLKD
jgi:hypothetical protein